MRRDYTNGSGYVCPTENAAVWSADHPQKPRSPVRTRVLTEDQIRQQGIQKTDARKQLDSLSEYVSNMPEVDPQIKKMRSARAACMQVCALAGIKITTLHMRYADEERVYTEEDLK